MARQQLVNVGFGNYVLASRVVAIVNPLSSPMRRLRDDARAEASHIIADARSRAESDAAQITENAQRSIESQQKQALVSLKGEVGTLATALAGKILGSELSSSATQTQMLDKMIDEMDAVSNK